MGNDKDGKDSGFFSRETEIERFGREYGYSGHDLDEHDAPSTGGSGSSYSETGKYYGLNLLMVIVGALGTLVFGIASLGDSDIVPLFFITLLFLVVGIIGLAKKS